MIRNRYCVVLIVGFAIVGLLTAWSAAVVVQGNPYHGRLLQVRIGMSVEQAVQVMGCPPNDWYGWDLADPQEDITPLGGPKPVWGGMSDWPPPRITEHFHLTWRHSDGSASFVDANKEGVTRAHWNAPTKPFWQRLRRRLHL